MESPPRLSPAYAPAASGPAGKTLPSEYLWTGVG
jgi:hypothetical protein